MVVTAVTTVMSATGSVARLGDGASAAPTNPEKVKITETADR